MPTTLKERWPECDIKHLVLETDTFVVFVDSELDVDWETRAKWDTGGPKNPAFHQAIMNEAAIIETTPCEHLSAILRLKFKRLIGEAVASSFSHDYENARKMLADAQNFINARNHEQSRSWYLQASGVAALCELIVGIVLWLLREPVSYYLGRNAIAVFSVTIAGGIGALLSIILRIGKNELDSASGRNLHYLEGVSRIVAGSLSGLLIFLAMKSGLIIPDIAPTSGMSWGMLLFAFVAGASERLAPSIITRLGRSADTDDSSANKADSVDKHNSGETS